MVTTAVHYDEALANWGPAKRLHGQLLAGALVKPNLVGRVHSVRAAAGRLVQMIS